MTIRDAMRRKEYGVHTGQRGAGMGETVVSTSNVPQVESNKIGGGSMNQSRNSFLQNVNPIWLGNPANPIGYALGALSGFLSAGGRGGVSSPTNGNSQPPSDGENGLIAPKPEAAGAKISEPPPPTAQTAGGANSGTSAQSKFSFSKVVNMYNDIGMGFYGIQDPKRRWEAIGNAINNMYANNEIDDQTYRALMSHHMQFRPEEKQQGMFGSMDDRLVWLLLLSSLMR